MKRGESLSVCESVCVVCLPMMLFQPPGPNKLGPAQATSLSSSDYSVRGKRVYQVLYWFWNKPKRKHKLTRNPFVSVPEGEGVFRLHSSPAEKCSTQEFRSCAGPVTAAPSFSLSESGLPLVCDYAMSPAFHIFRWIIYTDYSSFFITWSIYNRLSGHAK